MSVRRKTFFGFNNFHDNSFHRVRVIKFHHPTNLNKPAMKHRITGENSIPAEARRYTTKLHFTIYLGKLLRNSLRIHLSTSPIIPPAGSVYLDATNLRSTARNGFPSLTIFSDTKISRMLDGG